MKIVFFDFDGVIVDTYSFCFRIVESREYITEPDYRRRFEGNVFDADRKFKDPNTKLEDFVHHYTPELMKCEPIEKISKAIKELARKYKLIIISSTETEPIENFLQKTGLRECFIEILGCDVDRSKVNKINQSLENHHSDPSDSIFITDTLGDIREAEKCGVKSIAVTWGYHTKDTLEKGRPHAIVTEPGQIVEEVEKLL